MQLSLVLVAQAIFLSEHRHTPRTHRQNHRCHYHPISCIGDADMC